eukprot:TRINITY_DN15569_c0_g1_i1.p1 TRINITY_DN15569_c0_g1~~TRINITY_DN15569_c0_g1_i1.p1  ORF type:complete len:105 (-),score=6.55 TRINITY_DN15569_c0_g1_i1:708-1022(-)
MKAVTDILDACEMSIKNACKPPSSINTTTLDTCNANAIAFNKTVTACIGSATKGKDACSVACEHSLLTFHRHPECLSQLSSFLRHCQLCFHCMRDSSCLHLPPE